MLSPGKEYHKTEVHNLGRFISVMKFRPLAWRSTHPHLLADRLEDLTPTEEVRTNPTGDRKAALYGYLRGTTLKGNQKIHESEKFKSKYIELGSAEYEVLLEILVGSRIMPI